MKRFAYSLFAVALVALSGCQDDAVVEEQAVLPAQTGDEITFGSALTDVQLRTIYGDNPENGAYPVYWEDGDKVAIYCPDAAQTKMVEYKVTPDKNDSTRSAAVTKINPEEAGLQWGAEETHHFSAFYPADRILGMEDGKLKAEIPVNQDPIEWKKVTNEQGGTTYTGVANTDYAFMWAYNEHNKSDGNDVALNFVPWVTILDVEIKGPEQSTQKMSAVQIRSTTGETLNGEFLIDFNPVEDNPDAPNAAPVYIQSGNPNATRSQITIQLYDQSLDDGKGDFITLRPTDKIVVRFYLLPKDDNYDTTNRTDLQVRVTPFNSAVLTKTLDAEDGTHAGGILAHKVNKVILPPVNRLGDNYWMSSLNPNIYLTELSLPGSKMSYQIKGADGVNLYYQDLSIADQFTNGVRAFQLQTCGMNEGGSGGWLQEDPDMRLYMTVGGSRTQTRFPEVVKTIADGLKTAVDAGKTGEYAFILLTYSGAGEGYSSLAGGSATTAQAWMEAVRNDLNAMKNDSQYRLYTEEITPETTIGDVAGSIIVKVNFNEDDNMGQHLNANEQIPAMFAIWGLNNDDTDYSYIEEPTNAYAVQKMRWGTSNRNAESKLKWFYHEATSIGYQDNGGEEQASVKIRNIEDMWNKSIEYYKDNDNHAMWFLNDLGGSYVNGSYEEGAESQEGVDDWTKYVGPYATRLLQNRNADATLGIVLINYANPNDQWSGNLIQTVINNNFNFELRTSGVTQADNYNATYNNGGNAIGWDNQ